MGSLFTSFEPLQPIDTYTKEELYLLNQMLETQRAEMSRRETNLTALIENASELILSADENLNVLVINAALRRFVKNRYNTELKPGSHLPMVLPNDLAERWLPHFQKALKGIRLTNKIQSFVEGDHALHFELSFTPLLDEFGTLSGVSFFCKEVTKQEEDKEQIEQSKQLIESINYNIKEGIFRSNPEQGIIYVNNAFVELFGYENVEEVMTLEPYDLYVDSTRRDDFVNIMQAKTFFTNEEALFRRKDGSTFWGLMSSTKVLYRGRVYYDGAIRDVTKLKEADRRLTERNEELEKVNQELDSFVYRTSHDLRAPLASILGLINITRLASSETERTQYLDLMDQSILKLEGFIRDIIGYSRNSRMEVKYTPIDFEKSIETIFQGLDYMQGREQLVQRIQVRKSCEFYSDQIRLDIIFNNMISNAIRYREKSRDQSFLNIAIEIDEKKAVIELSDNGIGIEERYLNKIFDMFYRATQSSPGSGIGLYIVREAINKLGGKVSVDSIFGTGTTFRLEIPQGIPSALGAKYLAK